MKPTEGARKTISTEEDKIAVFQHLEEQFGGSQVQEDVFAPPDNALVLIKEPLVIPDGMRCEALEPGIYLMGKFDGGGVRSNTLHMMDESLRIHEFVNAGYTRGNHLDWRGCCCLKKDPMRVTDQAQTQDELDLRKLMKVIGGGRIICLELGQHPKCRLECRHAPRSSEERAVSGNIALENCPYGAVNKK